MKWWYVFNSWISCLMSTIEFKHWLDRPTWTAGLTGRAELTNWVAGRLPAPLTDSSVGWDGKLGYTANCKQLLDQLKPYVIAIVTVGQSWSLVMHEMKISQNTLKSGTFGAGLQALVDTLLCYEGLSVHANWSKLLLWYWPCVLVMYKVTIPLPISQRCARTFPPEVVAEVDT